MDYDSKPYASKRLRNWCFTLFGAEYLPNQVDFGPTCRGYIYQEEQCPETMSIHLQGYVEFTAATRFATVKAIFPTAHWEPRKGSRVSAIAYCCKPDTQISGPYYWGDVSPTKAVAGVQGRRSDLLGCYEMAKSGATPMEIYDKYPIAAMKCYRFLDRVAAMHAKPRTEKPTVYYVYGEPGVGKTTFAKTLVSPNHQEVYWKDAGSKWWDGYCGQPDVILDDFAGNWFPWSKLMKILQAEPENVEIKGASIPLACKTIVITSNYKPDEIYAEDKIKRPIAAFLRRIDHYITFDMDGEYTDHGNACIYWGLPLTDHTKRKAINGKDITEEYSTSEFKPPFEE